MIEDDFPMNSFLDSSTQSIYDFTEGYSAKPLSIQINPNKYANSKSLSHDIRIDLNSLVSNDNAIFNQICNSPQANKSQQQGVSISQNIQSIPEEPDKNDNMSKLSIWGTKIVMRKFHRLKIQDKDSVRKQIDIQNVHSLNISKLIPSKQEQAYKYYIYDLIDAVECSNHIQSSFLIDNFLDPITKFFPTSFDQRSKEQVCMPASQTQPQEYVQFHSLPLILNFYQKLVRKTLILDLDETLVHCNQNLSLKADFFLSLNMSVGQNIKAGVKVRPYLDEFLERMSKHFEVIIFTASHRIYAEAVLNKIDKKGSLVQFLFTRENCTIDKSCYIKDLRIISNRDMAQTIIVDNSTMSFIYQLENGVPIIPYYSDDSDRELIHLGDFLIQLMDVNDVREYLKEYFKLHQLQHVNDVQQAISLFKI